MPAEVAAEICMPQRFSARLFCRRQVITPGTQKLDVEGEPVVLGAQVVIFVQHLQLLGSGWKGWDAEKMRASKKHEPQREAGSPQRLVE